MQKIADIRISVASRADGARSRVLSAAPNHSASTSSYPSWGVFRQSRRHQLSQGFTDSQLAGTDRISSQIGAQ
jgi:hypothetical protein